MALVELLLPGVDAELLPLSAIVIIIIYMKNGAHPERRGEKYPATRDDHPPPPLAMPLIKDK